MHNMIDTVVVPAEVLFNHCCLLQRTNNKTQQRFQSVARSGLRITKKGVTI